MPKLAAHPRREELSAYSLGQMPEETAVAINSHISECEPCCETIVELSSEDTFAGLLQEAGRLPTDLTLDSGSSTAKSFSTSEDIPAPLAEHPRYEIARLIGKGGMGDVYEARHRMMERTVALKVIKQELMRNPEAVDRFHREVKAAAQLAHPDERFQTPEELAEALKPFSRSAEPREIVEPPTQAEPHRWMSTFLSLAAVAVLFVAAIFAGLGFFGVRFEAKPPENTTTLGAHRLTIVDTSGKKPSGGTSGGHQNDATGITTHTYESANGRYKITLVNDVLTVNGDKYTLENPTDSIRIVDDRVEITRVAEQGTKNVAPADRGEPAEATLVSDGATAAGDPGASPDGKPVSECVAIQAAVREYYMDKYPLFAASVNQNSNILSDLRKLREREWLRQIGELGANSPVSEVINSFPGKPYVTFTEVTQASRNEVLVVCVNLYRNADETCRVEVTKKQRKKRAGEPVALGKPITEEVVRKLVRTVAKDADFKQLQGKWDVIAFTQDGRKEFAADKGVGMLVQIKGDTITRIQTAPNGEKSEKEWGRIELNSSTNPKSIDIVNPDGPGGRLLGIYELKDGALKICFAERSNVDDAQRSPVKRPTTFDAPAGSELVLVECRRAIKDPDLKQLQGEWELLRVQEGDMRKRIPLGNALVTMKGNRLLSHHGILWVEIDSNKDPKTIDFYDPKGRLRLRGIYKFSDDRLIMILHEDDKLEAENPAYPKSFDPPADNDTILWELRKKSRNPKPDDGVSDAELKPVSRLMRQANEPGRESALAMEELLRRRDEGLLKHD